MITFTQRNGKINFKALGNMDTTPIINLYQKWPNLHPILEKLSDITNGFHGYIPGVVYGQPNNILKECENSPGVWIFDFSNNVTILMFSDGFRKNHYKGTSYELVLDNHPKEKEVIDAFNIFIDDFLLKLKEQNIDEFEKLNTFKKMKIK